MLLCSLTVSAGTYSIRLRANLQHGSISIPGQTADSGKIVVVDCEPSDGFGLSQGVFFATVDKNGKIGAPNEATCKAPFPDDRANKQRFEFKMPDADVEVWAEFAPLRTLIVHPAKGGTVKALYGVDKGAKDSTVARNVPRAPIVLSVKADDDYELVDVEILNVEPALCTKTNKQLTILMPNEDKTVHVTPRFAKINYSVSVSTTHEVEVAVSNKKPKTREEVEVTMLAKQGIIPNVSFEGCKSWWMVGKPVLQEGGRWKVVYRFKVDLSDVEVKVIPEQVYSISVNDKAKCNRVKYSVPEMIPGFPGFARKGQQVPVLFQMPEGYSVKCTYAGAPKSPMAYHNMLKNSFADEGMDGWKESNDYLSKRCLSMTTFADSTGNMYWSTSVKNSMSQTVSLAGLTYPESAVKDGKVGIATIVSANPRQASVAKVSLVPSGDFIKEPAVVVADLHSKNNGWETEFKMSQISKNVRELNVVVEAEGQDTIRKRAYEGPMFDNLCLLVPTSADTIRNEDVLLFTMDKYDVTIDFTPSAQLNKVKVAKNEHATLTLRNTVTGEEGDSVQAMKNDIIVIKGKSDATHAIYSVTKAKDVPPTDPQGGGGSGDNPGGDNPGGDNPGGDNPGGGGGEEPGTDFDSPAYRGNSTVFRSQADSGSGNNSGSNTSGNNSSNGSPMIILADSVSVSTHEFYAHYLMEDNQDIIFTPDVDTLKIDVVNTYGGKIAVSTTKPHLGEKVQLTVSLRPGSKLKQIKTQPAGVLTLKEESVDANTGAGTYSFEMPTAYFTLLPEFIVPITTAEQIDSISWKNGEFRLENDLDLGNNYNKNIQVTGYFDGNGHRITYGGQSSLFGTVTSEGSVRHLYVKANVKQSESYLGGIAGVNLGVIEDCEVSGTVRNTQKDGCAGGVAGQNGKGGIISHCHVLCEALDANTSCGIAYQAEGATLKNNVFNGLLVKRIGRAYMICNDMKNSTIENNKYIQNDANLWAEVCGGASVTNPTNLVASTKNMTETYPVLAGSIKAKYGDGFAIEFNLPSDVFLVNISQKTATAGTVVRASLKVVGVNHLGSVTVAASDGSNAQDCAFTDNYDNVYFFSFTMPAHDVRLSATTLPGLYIYTPNQFAEIHEKQGTFYLARDIELNNWEKSVVLNGTFEGGGHTIKYNATDGCNGLFSKIRRGAVLKNLRVVGNVETTTNCGGITFENQGTISDCHFSGRLRKLAVKSAIPTKVPDYVSAIACIIDKDASKIEYCSASAELTAPNSQTIVDQNPLCYQGNSNITNSHWISPTEQNQYPTLRNIAEAARKDHPVYAQGILDKTNPRIVSGTDTIRVVSGATLDQLTIVDGQPFVCTSDVQVNRIVYKRPASSDLEQWVLPFQFNRIAGNGSFEYHKAVVENKVPKIDPKGVKMTLSQSPASIEYVANEPMMVKGDATEFVLTNDRGPITIQATDNKPISLYASLWDRGLFYAAYDTVPAKVAKEGMMYVWDTAKQDFVLSDSVAIEPYHFYIQFYNVKRNDFVSYTYTKWGKNDKSASGKRAPAAPRRLSAAMADGWQPIFLDPRQPQSITAQMLDDYEVAYLTDLDATVVDENSNSPLSAISLVYQIADSYEELPVAIPLLVRAKRSDATPLVTEQMGEEIVAELLQSLLYDGTGSTDGTDGTGGLDDTDVTDIDLTELFNLPHYWVASFGNRLDIWPLPMPESYADWVDTGCLMFSDNYLEQTFNYPTATDKRTTPPMSYCISVLNTNTYEPLQLIGNRVFVEFIGAETDAETTGISLTPSPSPRGEGSGYSYNLNGQRVDASYKGVIIQNGRKVFRK